MLFDRIPGQLSDEKIIKIIRKDIFVLLKKILFIFLLLIFPVIFYQFIFAPMYPGLINGPVFYPVFILAISAYIIFLWLFLFFSFIDYYLDIWIITDERLIDIRQDGFFSRTIATQRLYRVQDVTSEVHGVMATLLKYGDVYVQTAGAKQRFHFDDISHPNKVRDMIIKLSEQSKKKHNKE